MSSDVRAYLRKRGGKLEAVIKMADGRKVTRATGLDVGQDAEGEAFLQVLEAELAKAAIRDASLERLPSGLLEPAWIRDHDPDFPAGPPGLGGRSLRRNMGTEALLALWETQGGRCGICKEPLDLHDARKSHVDHCHATGQMRGLLCPPCNWGLGYFRDNAERLQAAIEYLARHRGAAP